MEHHHIHVHVNKVQEVCGRLLVAPRDKKSRRSYQCTEFADLQSVFGIDTPMMLSTFPHALILLSM